MVGVRDHRRRIVTVVFWVRHSILLSPKPGPAKQEAKSESEKQPTGNELHEV